MPPATPKAMTIVRPIVSGAMLTAADLAGIGAGGVPAHLLTGSANQVWIQLPVALLVTLGSFFLWVRATRIRRLAALRLENPEDLAAGLFASIAWGVVLFVPIHFLAPGYVTSFGNIVARAVYQLVVNPVARFGPVALSRPPP